MGRRRPPRKSEASKKGRKSTQPTVAELLTKAIEKGQSIPIIDIQTYKKEYPTSQRNSPEQPIEPKTLPEPVFTINESYKISDMPCKPTNYIRFLEPTKEELDAQIQYDMDEEDIAWLEGINDVREKNGISRIGLDDFEILMDRFEKECHFEVKPVDENGKSKDKDRGTLDIHDDEALCCICGDGESQNMNEILFCEMCNLAFHQECYGVPYIPENQWLCRKCIFSPSKPMDCILCPNVVGAIKTTDEGFWAHIVCASWIPEVQFANPVFLEPIDNILNIAPPKWKLTCFICKKKGVGVCIQCTHKKCNIAFHPTCAQQADIHMKFKGRPSDPWSKTNRSIFCHLHSPKEEELDKKTKQLRDKLLQSIKTPILFMPTLPPERIQDIGNLVNIEKKNIFIAKLISYWKLKRHVRCGAPLLPNRYNMKKNELLIQPSQDGNSFQEEYKQLLMFRQDFEKVRLLLELVRKREKMKNELIKTKQGWIEMKLTPIVPFLRNMVKCLVLIDQNNIFEKPVDTTVVTNYTDIVTNPMDLSTMLSKVNKYEYNTFQEFESDFNLMIDNCLLFNSKKSIYYKAAIHLRQKSKSIFKQVKQDVENLNFDSVVSDVLDASVKTELVDNKSAIESAENVCNPQEEVANIRNRKRKTKLSANQKENNYVKEEYSSPERLRPKKDQNRNTLFEIDEPNGDIGNIKAEREDMSGSNIKVEREDISDVSIKEEEAVRGPRRMRRSTARKESHYSL